MRSPFAPPGEGVIDRNGMQKGGNAVLQSSAQVRRTFLCACLITSSMKQRRTPCPQPQQPRATTVSSNSSASRAATPHTATRQPQGLEPPLNSGRSAMPPSLNKHISTANQTAARAGSPSTQAERQRSPSPPDGTIPAFTRYGVSSLTYADVVGDVSHHLYMCVPYDMLINRRQLPRISKPYHGAS